MSSEIPFTEGDADFQVEGAGQPCKTHYKIFGHFPSPTNVSPLIILHGGPGVPHNYLLPIHLLSHPSNPNPIPTIFYDQLGCGLSTHLPHLSGEAGAEFWTPSLFLSELTNLLSHFSIKKYSILGNSWGGMLASMHGVLQPPGLEKLVVANSPASMELWISAANKLRNELPEQVREVLDRCEKEGRTDSEEYQDATKVFYERHVCRVLPWPRELMETFEALEGDKTVYLSMNGPSEFHVTGTLKTWSIISQLQKITVPTLLINGKYDEAQDEVVEPLFRGIGKVKWVKFAESSHMPQLEEREEFLKVIRGFLDG